MHKTEFLKKLVLGRKKNLNNPQEVISQCIRLAYRDMLTAGRYYISYDMSSQCNEFKSILEKSNYVYSREIIEIACSLFGDKEEIGTGTKYVTRYGLAQKLVNMTYKYLYVFSDHIDKEIDFSNCDCPLDSIILKNLQLTKYTWSKLTKIEYEQCQEVIAKHLQKENNNNKLDSIGNLAYDFLNW